MLLGIENYGWSKLSNNIMDISKFKEIIKDFFGIKVKLETDELILFEIMGEARRLFESNLNKLQFQSFVNELTKYQYSKTMISSNNSFECLIKFKDFNPFQNTEREEIIDEKNNVKYRVDKPSVYLLFSILISLHDNIGRSGRNYFFKNFKKNSDYFLKYPNNHDTIELVSHLCEDFQSIKITSLQNIDLLTFKKLANAFLFEISYSFDSSVCLVENSIRDIFWTTKHRGKLRKRINEINAPEKLFDPKLLNYYQRAISNEAIEYQYISLYHIVEYFFDKAYAQDKIQFVSGLINLSNLDNNSSDSITMLIDSIILDYHKINEKEQLILTLKTYLNPINDLIDELRSYEPKLIDYFKNNEIPFSKEGGKVDFENKNSSSIIKQLANRIYKTRNELVHRKSKKTMFIHTEHEKALINETLLLRIISEILIMKDGKSIEIGL